MGLWLIVWLAFIIKNKGIKFGGWRCAECGSADVTAKSLTGGIKDVEPQIKTAGEVQLAASNSANRDTFENEKICLQEQKNRKSRVAFEKEVWDTWKFLKFVVFWGIIIWVGLAIWAAISISNG